MTVVTTLRRYAFELTAREATGPSDPNIVYTVRFSYPESAAPPPPPPPPPPARETGPVLSDINLAYSTRGGGRLPAVRVFDDKRATYFQFGEAADAPAIFIIGADGKEELVNAQWRGQYMVVDQVAREFVLRIGRQSVRVRNDAWAPSLPAPAPAPDGRN
jgi:type IV secretion system protein VirB9